MMSKNSFVVDEHRLVLLSFENIFKRIELQLLNDLNEYSLIVNDRIDLRNQDTKRLLYHNLIHTICDTIIRYRQYYKRDIVILYDTIFTQDSEICKFIDCTVLYKQLCTCLSKIQTILPIHIVKCTDTVDNTFLANGEGIDLLHTLTNDLNKPTKQKTFKKINDFTVKYDLTFLNERYFNKLNTKLLLL